MIANLPTSDPSDLLYGVAPGISWHSASRPLYVPMVEIPRELALDLVRMLSMDDLINTTPEEELKSDIDHERLNERHEAHRERMEALADMISADWVDVEGTLDAALMLRLLSLVYEGPALVGKAGAQ